MYATVILPLALPQALTYAVPPTLEVSIQVGSRVVVPLAKRRFYTAIVESITDTPPNIDGEIKAVNEVADSTPILLPNQLSLWHWMADYYMCLPGEVMKAALPSGLKLESETLVRRNADFEEIPSLHLSPRQRSLLQALPQGESSSIESLEKQLHLQNLITTVRQLIDVGALSVSENLVQGFRPRTENHVRLTESFFSEPALNDFFNTLHRSPAQAALLTRYLDIADASSAFRLGNVSLLREVSRCELLGDGGSPATLAELRKKGVLEVYPYEVGRLKKNEVSAMVGPRPLSREQQRAYEAIGQSFSNKRVCLLHGVTSSGKTEVYIHLINQTIAAGGQVLYLVPEIALTTQLTSRLSRVFGDKMGVYHSKFPDAERVEMWKHQLTPDAYPLILGVRSSIFLPFRNLRLIIVDEEHETSYKQAEPAPRYNARDAAIVLAHQVDAKVLLGTATPSVETYNNALQGKYGLVEMMHRYAGVELPEIVVEDVKELRRKRLMPTPFAPRLIEEVRSALQRGEQAIFFQNRRGYSPVMQCRTCGWVPRCTKCDVSLTYHQKQGKLVCHYCGTAYDIPRQCPNCGDTELRDIGYGTERIEAAAEKVFLEAHTARMDLDTTRSRSSYENIIHDFQMGKSNLLIGTQMVTKGLDFDRVSIVGILSADQMLNQPDFRAYERAFCMMMQVAGRAGRRGKRGLVVLQTRQPDLPVLRQIVEGNYAQFFKEQMMERRDFRYPPFTRLINVYLKHRMAQTVERAAQVFARLIAPHFGNNLLGPEVPYVGRVQLLYIRKIMLKTDLSLPTSGVRRTLIAARDIVLSQQGMGSVHIIFDVDPL